mmetsp:Transcript_24158/g.63045  ORF Transcript_24158/g.63045 Transcript_24158/m.63045 type:complete len:360 (-) Transcript_24158:281-1360(-)
MDAWQKRYEDLAAFICIGCAGPELSVAFSQRLKLRHTTVTVAEDNPSWGQLGCNGFIILDSKLNVVCAATAAFMEVRQLAFGHVESVLDALIAGEQPPRVHPGMEVTLQGLAKGGLNGEVAVCLEGPAGPEKRCTVLLSTGRKISVKEINLAALGEVTDPPASDGAAQEPPARNCEGGNCALPVRSAKRQKPEPVCESGACALPAASPSSGGAAPCGDDAEARLVSPLADIASVRVEVLDKEHGQCATALANLVRNQSRAALESVLEVYRAHFDHEEELLERYVYADIGSGGFSAAGGQRKSHYADHARMIRAISSQLATGADVVPSAFVNQVLRDFETHANTYDDTYADKLSARMASV